MWKLSQFTVVHNLGERGLPDHVLVFNTFTSRSMTVKQDIWENIIAVLDAPSEAPPEIQRSMRRLVEMGVAVSKETDERLQWSQSFDEIRYHPRRIFPILAVTTACNIGCTYCYEAGVQGQTMSQYVIQGVLHWLENRIVHNGIKEIYPSLFGGEPLMYPTLLFTLMDGFNAICRRHSAICAYTSSSNGLLMTSKLAEQLAARGLTQIQISLDGPKCVHDERRIGKRGEPSYDQALRGIKCAVEYIQNVTVKVNFDRHNCAAIPELYNSLIDEGLHTKVDVKLEAIAHQFPDSKVIHNPECIIPPESEELADTYHELMLEARQRGIRVSRDTAHTTPCMFSSHHGVIIGPDGSIYKCISLVGRNEYRVGTVIEEHYNEAEYGRQMNTMKRLEECFEEECPYVPVCAGGCAYESAVRTGRYDLRFCTKENLKAYHYKRHLIRYQKELMALGMRPLTLEELRASRKVSGYEEDRARPTAVQAGCNQCRPSSQLYPSTSTHSLVQLQVNL